MNLKKPIFVTKPFLPALEEFQRRLPEIWESRILSNNGPMVKELEKKLCHYLQVPHISLVSNATIGLMIAIKALGIKGDIITTPFSFVATAHAVLWNNLKPVFVDIEEDSLNIDVNRINSALSNNTEAILPVHCYGNVCSVETINNIAQKNNLKVIYDAAHAFGVNDKNGSILNYGDLSVVSFHATKVFNTFEGGAIVSQDIELKEKIDSLINFSIDYDSNNVNFLGLNGKMSEIAALNGICQLDHIDDVFNKRKKIYDIYKNELSEIDGIKVYEIDTSYRNGFSYMPILVTKNFKLSRDELSDALKEKDIHTKKYFFPLITNFQRYKNFFDETNDNLNFANKAADEILCLPIYPDLELSELDFIIDSIKSMA